MRSRCAPGFAKPGAQAGEGGAARSPGPHPGNAGAAHASLRFGVQAACEPLGTRDVTRDLAQVAPARIRLKLRSRRVRLFSRDCDTNSHLGVVRRSACLCPRKRGLWLGYSRWMFGALRAQSPGIRFAFYGLVRRGSGELRLGIAGWGQSLGRLSRCIRRSDQRAGEIVLVFLSSGFPPRWL